MAKKASNPKKPSRSPEGKKAALAKRKQTKPIDLFVARGRGSRLCRAADNVRESSVTKKPKPSKGKPKPRTKPEDVVHGPPFDVPGSKPPGGGAINPFPARIGSKYPAGARLRDICTLAPCRVAVS